MKTEEKRRLLRIIEACKYQQNFVQKLSELEVLDEVIIQNLDIVPVLEAIIGDKLSESQNLVFYELYCEEEIDTETMLLEFLKTK